MQVRTCTPSSLTIGKLRTFSVRRAKQVLLAFERDVVVLPLCERDNRKDTFYISITPSTRHQCDF